MNLTFKFKEAKVVKTASRNKKVIVRNATATIVETDDLNKFNVLYKGSLIPLTDDSYDCKGKPDVWLRSKESRTGWIRIVRNEDIFHMTPCPEGYFPFRPKFIARGNIVDIQGEVKFKLIRCVSEQQLSDVNAHITKVINEYDNSD